MTYEQIEKQNVAFLKLKSKCLDEQVSLSKERQPTVEDKWNLPLVPQEMKDKIGEANAWENEDNMSFTDSDIKRLIKVCNQHMAFAKENGNLTEEAAAYYSLGTVYNKLGYLEKAIEYYGLLHAVCKNAEDRAGEIWACLKLGKAYHDAGDLMKAIKSYRVCLNICRYEEETIGEKAVCNILGYVHYKLGEYKAALHYCERSLAICKELGNRHEEARDNGRLGLLYKMINDSEKAIEHFAICLTISQKVGDQHGENIAIISQHW